MEVQRILSRYGATSYFFGQEQKRAAIAFTLHDKSIRLLVKLPDRNDFEITATGRRRRSDDAGFHAWEQACRQRWRVLCLLLKAKLEAVAEQPERFDDEFLPYFVLTSGRTVGEELRPQLNGRLGSRLLLPPVEVMQ